MENLIFQIYGTLILTLAGFVLPIIVISISIFPDGVQVLKVNYKNKQKQAEKNLADELSKQKQNSETDYKILDKNISKLKSAQRTSKNRILYLNPNYILYRSSFTIASSFVSFLVGLYLYSTSLYFSHILILISVGFLAWTIAIFFNAIEIIIEASTEVQRIRKSGNEKQLELLTTLVDNSKTDELSLFIEPDDIRIYFENEVIEEAKIYIFSINKMHKVAISLENLSEYMFKTAELGFTFPTEVLIEDASNISIYNGEKEKIVRFNHDYIQSDEKFHEGGLNLTFLKTGTFDVDVFVKGENLKKKLIDFKIRVIN